MFLKSVNWQSKTQVREAHHLLTEWTPSTNPLIVLELLAEHFSDERVGDAVLEPCAEGLK